MNRRAFIVGLGLTAAWPPLDALQPNMPVVGFLHRRSAHRPRELLCFAKA
jgi:hypothetical protein